MEGRKVIPAFRVTDEVCFVVDGVLTVANTVAETERGLVTYTGMFKVSNGAAIISKGIRWIPLKGHRTKTEECKKQEDGEGYLWR